MTMPRKNAAGTDKSVQRWAPPLKGAFLDALRTVRFITQACDLVKVPRSTVYDWREEDPAFRDAMDEAELRYADTLREEAHKLAMGENREQSVEMLKTLLKAKAPEFQDKAAKQVNITFLGVLVGRFQDIIQRVVPIKCPHCAKPLETRSAMSREMEMLGHADFDVAP